MGSEADRDLDSGAGLEPRTQGYEAADAVDLTRFTAQQPPTVVVRTTAVCPFGLHIAPRLIPEISMVRQRRQEEVLQVGSSKSITTVPLIRLAAAGFKSHPQAVDQTDHRLRRGRHPAKILSGLTSKVGNCRAECVIPPLGHLIPSTVTR